MFPRTQRYWDIGQGGFGWKWEKSDGGTKQVGSTKVIKETQLVEGATQPPCSFWGLWSRPLLCHREGQMRWTTEEGRAGYTAGHNVERSQGLPN